MRPNSIKEPLNNPYVQYDYGIHTNHFSEGSYLLVPFGKSCFGLLGLQDRQIKPQ